MQPCWTVITPEKSIAHSLASGIESGTPRNSTGFPWVVPAILHAATRMRKREAGPSNQRARWVVSADQWGGAMQQGKSFLIRDLLGDVLLPGSWHSLFTIQHTSAVRSSKAEFHLCVLLLLFSTKQPVDCKSNLFVHYLFIYLRFVIVRTFKTSLCFVLICNCLHGCRVSQNVGRKNMKVKWNAL
jgi:hypothetical protein